VLGEVLLGHSNAVCSLAVQPLQPHLLSCAADQTVRLWSVGPVGSGSAGGAGAAANGRLLAKYNLDEDQEKSVQPTCVIFNESGTQFVLAQTNGSLLTVDVETGKTLLKFEVPGPGAHSSFPFKLIHPFQRAYSILMCMYVYVCAVQMCE